MSDYTDIENTGLPVVPDLTDRTDSFETLDEGVWSHRTDRPTSTSTDQ